MHVYYILYFLCLSALLFRNIFILLKWSHSPARPAAAPMPAPVSIFIHIAVQTSKKAGYYATMDGFTHFVDFYYGGQSVLY